MLGAGASAMDNAVMTFEASASQVTVYCLALRASKGSAISNGYRFLVFCGISAN